MLLPYQIPANLEEKWIVYVGNLSFDIAQINLMGNLMGNYATLLLPKGQKYFLRAAADSIICNLHFLLNIWCFWGF